MTRKLRFLALGFLLVLATAFGPAFQAQAAPALWRYGDQDTTVYLFGTIHIMEPSTPWLSPEISKAFDSAGTLIVELDDGQLQKAGPLFAAAGRLPEDQTLRLVVGTGVYNDVLRLCKKLSVPTSAFDHARPWFTAMSLSVGSLVRAGYNPASGADKAFLAMAEKGKKAVVPLETASFQAGLFGGLDPASEKAMLIQTLREASKIKAIFGDMQEAWVAGEPDRLAHIINASMETSPALADRLLYARNRDWAGKLSQLLDHPGVFFVAVGAGHLAGDKSVIALMTHSGIVIKRVE
ncbi:TraB/GumN family protein [Kordiimonas marina]|uniref:TraB/GumN family protein n=1 Tax=Kordiimonas marina TaxID=2872312 RepID=UPI001FF4E857|nr:TraB/GumN family protein [Kordiimonas marina]